MFRKLRTRWQEADGDVLRKEVEDSIFRLQSADKHVNAICVQTMASTYRKIENSYGPLSNVSNKGKLQIAKTLLEQAKNIFDNNMGQGHGLFLLSAYLKAQALPGEDAQFVIQVTQDVLEKAQELTKDGREHPIKEIAIEEYLRILGFDITQRGKEIALLEARKDPNALEIASHMALITMAQDAREANPDPMQITRMFQHSIAILECLKEYLDEGRISKEAWEPLTESFYHITYPSEHTEEWVDKVLQDQLAKHGRLATSRIDYGEVTAES